MAPSGERSRDDNTAERRSAMRPLYTFLFTLICLGAHIGATSQAHAILPKFGLKLGMETWNSSIDGSPNSTFTGLATVNMNLLIVNLEGNLGLHNSTVAGFRDDPLVFSNFENLELVTAIIGRVNIPIVPLVASGSFGAGIDQRVMLSQTHIDTDKKVDDASLIRTMLPISAMVSAGIPKIISFHLEARFNLELTNSYSRNDVKRDLDKNHELWFLLGASF